MGAARRDTGRRKPGPYLGILGAIVLLIGLAVTGGGGWLLLLGGSAYYLVAGLVLIAGGVLLFLARPAAIWLFALLVLGTLIWALVEIGFDWWPLVPRGDLVFILGLVVALPWTVRRLRPGTPWLRSAAPLVGALVLAALAGIVSLTRDLHDRPGRLPGPRVAAVGDAGVPAGDWPAYARSWYGDKYSPLTQITPANAGALKVAWSYRTGDMKGPGDPDETTYEVTPLKVGNAVYLCTPHNIVIALEPETGRQLWRFDPHVQASQHMQHLTCRGVSYLDTAAGGGAVAADCPQRLFVATNDSRLIALDPRTGQPCRSFGRDGTVSLLEGQSNYNGGWYQYTSAPLVARGLIVLGGAIFDNASIHAPAGVIRAYDGRTGRLVWNFDPARPDDTAPIAPGQHYTPSTPNMWSTPAADEALGMVYLPMGMGAVDQWGGWRPASTETFATTVLALDLATGRPRWRYQTVHHDLWDMDIPAQPALVDLTLPGRGKVPALVQSTKTGLIFVLDRRTGVPLFPTPERPVPQGAAPGDHTSPTQPFSSVSFLPPRITEQQMWGATMLDQLWCRIRFKSLRYEGPFTPPSLKGTLVFPGNFGVMDWGGMAIDPVRQVAFAHPNTLAFVDRLVPRSEGTGGGDGPAGGSDLKGSSEKGYNPNRGAPFAVDMNPFLSPLGLPCQAPPWGYVAGLDLVSGKIAWQHKNGTIRKQSPVVPLPFKLGVPSLGGPMMTAGGVAFLSSAIDDTARAYDTATGRVLWEKHLPAGGQSTPMTYLGRDGKQYVIVVAGGHGSLGTTPGDHVIAYRL